MTPIPASGIALDDAATDKHLRTIHCVQAAVSIILNDIPRKNPFIALESWGLVGCLFHRAERVRLQTSLLRKSPLVRF